MAGNYVANLEQNNERQQGNMNEKDKEEVIEAACARFQQMIDNTGFAETASLLKEHLDAIKNLQPKKRGKAGMLINQNENPNPGLSIRMGHNDAPSEITIYRNALIDQTGLNVNDKENDSH